MIYGLLRWFTGIALHWFYSSIRVEGGERIPKSGPVIVAASHHNALVDALIAGWITPRRVTVTAKATLTKNPFLAWLFPKVGVVPLRRVSDEKGADGSPPDARRNAVAFENILDVLENSGMVLIFPEGKSHSDPELAPLKTGVSRIALTARDTRQISQLQIIPLGINFEDKGKPGTAVLAEVGDPFEMDRAGNIGVEELTVIIGKRLAAVSLKKPAPTQDRGEIRRADAHPLASPLATWGELTHRYIINYARDTALRRSKSADEPAMLTIVIALILILGSYVTQFAIVAVLLNLWIALAYVATLPMGAYWAAYQNHALHPQNM